MIDSLDAMDEGDETLLAEVIAHMESLKKARERKFQSRSEAARYAAQIRWGNRGATTDATVGDGYHLALPVTFDKSEAILTGRPYGPLMEENFPPELKEMGAKVEALNWSDEKREDRELRAQYETALTAYFMGQLGVSDLTPEAQEALKQWGEKSGVYRGIPPRTAEERGRFAEQRAELATKMAQEQVKKVVERSYIREKIGTDEAMKYTKDIIHGGPEARITVSVDGPALVQIMSSGSLTTQFETGTTNGALNRTIRAGHEAVAYGTHPLADPRKRPIYGGYHPEGIRTPEADLSYQYGDFQLVMKREVTARATVSVSDSLGSQRNANPATGAVRPQTHPLGWKPDNPMAPQNMRTRIRNGERTQYAESQIHGGVSLKDVSHVAVAAGARIPASVEARLEALGIPVIRHRRVSQTWTAESKGQFPLTDDSKVAKSLRLNMTEFLTDAIEKARERKYQSRSEAARHAANIRWANHYRYSTKEPQPTTTARERQDKMMRTAENVERDLAERGFTVEVLSSDEWTPEVAQEALQSFKMTTRAVYPTEGYEWYKPDQKKGWGHVNHPMYRNYERASSAIEVADFDIARMPQGIPNATVMVVRHKTGAVAGMMVVLRNQVHADGTPELHLRALTSSGLVPGIGTALFVRAVRMAASDGVDRLSLTSLTESKRFYRGLGMKLDRGDRSRDFQYWTESRPDLLLDGVQDLVRRFP